MRRLFICSNPGFWSRTHEVPEGGVETAVSAVRGMIQKHLGSAIQVKACPRIGDWEKGGLFVGSPFDEILPGYVTDGKPSSSMREIVAEAAKVLPGAFEKRKKRLPTAEEIRAPRIAKAEKERAIRKKHLAEAEKKIEAEIAEGSK